MELTCLRGPTEYQVGPTNGAIRNQFNLSGALRSDANDALLPVRDKSLCRRGADLAQASSKPSLCKAELLSIGLDIHSQNIAPLFVICNSVAICADERQSIASLI